MNLTNTSTIKETKEQIKDIMAYNSSHGFTEKGVDIELKLFIVYLSKFEKMSFPDKPTKFTGQMKNNLGMTHRKGGKYWATFNRKYMSCTEDILDIHSTIAHEAIHFMEGCFDHGSKFCKWKDILNEVFKLNISIKSDPKQYSKVMMEIALNPKNEWILRCKACGGFYIFNRAGKRVKGILDHPDNWKCGKCGQSNWEVEHRVNGVPVPILRTYTVHIK